VYITDILLVIPGYNMVYITDILLVIPGYNMVYITVYTCHKMRK